MTHATDRPSVEQRSGNRPSAVGTASCVLFLSALLLPICLGAAVDRSPYGVEGIPPRSPAVDSRPGEGAPDAPSQLRAYPQSASEGVLIWNDNSTGESGFEVELRAGGGAFQPIGSVPANSVGALITGLSASTNYSFRVRTFDATGSSNYTNVASLTTDPLFPTCADGSQSSCLLTSERFLVRVEYYDFEGERGRGNRVAAPSDDSGLFWFFDANNWEMLVKAVDGCQTPLNSFWFFSAATTNVEYLLRVTDTVTGTTQGYFNPLGNAAPAIGDTEFFATCDESSATVGGRTPPESSLVLLDRIEESHVSTLDSRRADELLGAVRSQADSVSGRGGACLPSGEDHCLLDGRFRVELEFEDFMGVTRPAGTVPFGSADSGLYWFFDPDNWEMLVKLVDACQAPFDRFWVFAAATTNVGYTLTVTDTASGEQRSYTNPVGNLSPAIIDIDAFDTCDAGGGGGGGEPPSAVFTSIPSVGGNPRNIGFNGTFSSDPDGQIVAYSWSFGDGTSASGASVTHVYNNDATYDVTLTVTDDDGNTDSSTHEVLVPLPTIEFPGLEPIGSNGGIVTNPDGTSVVVPPGALSGSQTAMVGVTGVPLSVVEAIARSLGIQGPDGLQLTGSGQVNWQATMNPALPVTLTLPRPSGTNPDAIGIHTLIEPNFIAGNQDSRPPRLIYDGEVQIGADTVSMQISPQNFGSPPGRSCFIQVPPTMPTCFVSGSIVDSNGSPQPLALVEASTLAGMQSRANSLGFYRAIVKQGTSTLTVVTTDGRRATRSVQCNASSMPRISGVDIVVSANDDPSVPEVDITDPAMDVTVDSTLYEISGTVSPTSISEILVTTQTGDNAEVFSQVEPVSSGQFSSTVVLTAGRENTVSAFAADQGRIGSDSVVITSEGSDAEDLRFTLTWDTGVDMDIYVRTPGPNGVADGFDGSTIFWANRNADGGALDVDDLNGFGPENITFPDGAASNGTYAFAVQAYDPPNNTTATLSVFVNGSLRGTFTSLFTVDNQRDIYGTVSYPSGAIGPPIAEADLCPPSAFCVSASSTSGPSALGSPSGSSERKPFSEARPERSLRTGEIGDDQGTSRRKQGTP